MNIDYKLMKDVCLSRIESFYPLGKVMDTPDGMYIYRDNPKAKILGVAHLDSVLDLQHFYKLELGKDTLIFNAQLDDRLGAYILLDVLPKMGIQFDLLLTEGEETGRSTAAYFETSKQYNWMFSFDRHGDTTVMYQYDNKALRADLQSVKLKPDRGSFSDICFLDHLGIRGINVGTGYEDEHSNMCYANIGVTVSQIKKFHHFYELFKDKKYEYVQSVSTSKYDAYPVSWSKLSENDICYICNQPKPNGDYYNDVYICDDCLSHVGECVECGDIVNDTDLQDGICSFCRIHNG